jgi:hypothetical protein
LFRLEVAVLAADGSSEVIGVGMAQSHDYGDKAVYQAQQNAIKYVLIEAFAIPTSDGRDMDAREASEIPAPTDPWPVLWERARIFKAWDDKERQAAILAAMKYLGIEEITELEHTERVFSHLVAEYEKRPTEGQEAMPV